MRIRGLLLCAALLASGVSSASATMRIAEMTALGRNEVLATEVVPAERQLMAGEGS